MSWCLKKNVLLAPYLCYHIFGEVKVNEWPPIGKIAAHSGAIRKKIPTSKTVMGKPKLIIRY